MSGEGKLAFVLDNPEVSTKRLRLAGDLAAERIKLDVEELRSVRGILDVIERRAA